MRIPRRAVLTAAVFLILLGGVAHAQTSAGRFRIDSMLGRDRLYFEVPLQATGASYRVRVLSWDSFATGQ